MVAACGRSVPRVAARHFSSTCLQRFQASHKFGVCLVLEITISCLENGPSRRLRFRDTRSQSRRRDWKHGLAETSVQDLEEAPGVRKSGLYTEFKDKRRPVRGEHAQVIRRPDGARTPDETAF